ncbi:serine/threonine-protein kinase, partial [Acidobacteria bacterium AH-259-D05]|nr:serine/threonine-protein kinase [Acidobacteria bacterium AH-259-D05]
MIGKTLSHYKILEKIGQGGMGEVYLAKDSRLDRKVALKILPQHLAERADLRERFEREARAVSSLNHPHICTLHDIGEQDGIHYLVMEYLEGESLAARLEKGALSLERTLEYAIQIADALDKAHRQGVVHRDLKPGNIMLTKSGAKLLDFGLAKLQAAETPTNLSALPTEQANLTAEGTILGTLQYMAPEQLEAKEADARTDIFAFGAVIYEMATGKKAFEGTSQASLIAAIMEKDPRPMSELQPMTPSVLDWVVTRCLAKEPDERVQTAADLMAELRWVAEVGTQVGPSPAVAAPAAWRRAIPWSIAAIAVVAAIVVVIAAVTLWSDPPVIQTVQPVTRTEITLPSTSPLGFGATYGFDPTLIALSPDGTTLVFVGKTGEGTQLYRREMDSLEITPIEDTEEAMHPFFSPDSNWVGFLTRDRVKKISLRGGGPITLCQAPTPIRATWTHDDMIYFGSHEGKILNSVPASGGEPKLIVNLGYFPSDDRPNLAGQLDEILPDGQSALVTVRIETSISADSARIYVLSLETLEKKLLIEGGYGPRYVPSGHLLFARTGVLMAVPFDLERLEVQGEPQVVLKGVSLESLFVQVQVSFSDTGTLVYSPGGDATVGRIARVDRHGKTELLSVLERVYGVFDLSPNDQRLAAQVADVNDYIW